MVSHSNSKPASPESLETQGTITDEDGCPVVEDASLDNQSVLRDTILLMKCVKSVNLLFDPAADPREGSETRQNRNRSRQSIEMNDTPELETLGASSAHWE